MELKSYIYSSFLLTLLFGTLVHASIPLVLAGSEENTAVAALKTNNTDVTNPGETLTYSIIIQNPTSEDVTVTIKDTLPNYLLPIATSPEAVADADTRTITWEQIVIPAAQEITVGLQAQALDTTPHNHVIENTAHITGDNVDLVVSDTTRVETTQAAPADPIAPTAPTGTSHVILALSALAVMAGIFGGRRILSHIA